MPQIARTQQRRPGYGFILVEFLPRLRVAALDEADAQALVVANPAGFLTWRAG